MFLIFWGGNECASRAREEEEETRKEFFFRQKEKTLTLPPLHLGSSA